MLPFNQTTLTPKPLNPTPSPNHHHQPPSPPPPSSSSSTAQTMTNTNPILDSNPPNLEGDSDSDIDALINAFFEPNPQFPSLDHLQGSTSDAKESSLKRGLDTGDDSSQAPIPLKRGRIDNVFFHRADLHAVIQIQNPIPSPLPLSQSLSHAAATNGDTQAVEGQGKRPVFDSDFLSRALREAEAESVFPQNSDDNDDNFDVEPADFSAPYVSLSDYRRIRNMERFRQIAKESATHYARFTSEDSADERPSSSAAPQGIDDSTSPFSISMKAIKEGATKKKGRETWVAKSQKREKRVCVPSLQELCLRTLADNADAMVSLEGVPDELRHKLCKLLCDSRKMNSHFLELLLSGSPTEIRLRDCSWLTVEQFAECFHSCDTGRLEVCMLFRSF